MTTEDTSKKLQKLKMELKKIVIGRDDIIDTLILGLASNHHALIVGKHGESKSMLVEQLAKASGLKYFYSQIHQETIVKDIVGLLNPLKYREGKLDIIKTKFWDSEILFFDEAFRGRTEFLDLLLEVMIERKTSKTLLGETPLPIISVVCTSNPTNSEFYNTERIDLALKDRFFAIVNIDHLIESDLNHGHIKTILLNDTNTIDNVGLTREELVNFAKESKKVAIDVDTVIEIFANANMRGFPFSTRFIKTFKEICQGFALLDGRDKTKRDDYFEVALIMLQNRYDGLKKNMIEDMVDEAVLKQEYSDVIIKVREISEITKEDTAVFIEKAIDLIEETKEDFPQMPQRLKDRIDNMISTLEDKIRLNIDNEKIVNWKQISNLDTERFKPLIQQFIDHHIIETKYMNLAGYKKAKQLLQGVKYCTIETEKKMKYAKLKIIPKIDEPKSFDELKLIKDILNRNSILVNY
jgi:hypothetical protein